MYLDKFYGFFSKVSDINYILYVSPRRSSFETPFLIA